MIIELDKQIEVTKDQYQLLKHNFSGICTFRESNDKYYIKVWYNKYINIINQFLGLNFNKEQSKDITSG